MFFEIICQQRFCIPIALNFIKIYCIPIYSPMEGHPFSPSFEEKR
jgi:hypothetical protein